MLADLFGLLTPDHPWQHPVYAAFRSCTGRAITAHHTLPRGMGGRGSNEIWLLRATCNECHEFVESHPAIAEAAGLKVRHSR
jgi:hypothetical protein